MCAAKEKLVEVLDLYIQNLEVEQRLRIVALSHHLARRRQLCSATCVTLVMRHATPQRKRQERHEGLYKKHTDAGVLTTNVF